MAIPYNYKFGGKELQETGQYDFGGNAHGSVTDASGGSVGGDFTTEGGIAVNGVTGSGWFSGLSNFFTNNGSDTFSISPGGTNTNVGYSGFRPGKDDTADAGGFFGGMLNGLGGKFDIKMPRFESILGFFKTGSEAASLYKKPIDTFSVYREHYTGAEQYMNGGRVTEIKTTGETFIRTGLSKQRADSINRFLDRDSVNAMKKLNNLTR